MVLLPGLRLSHPLIVCQPWWAWAEAPALISGCVYMCAYVCRSSNSRRSETSPLHGPDTPDLHRPLLSSHVYDLEADRQGSDRRILFNVDKTKCLFVWKNWFCIQIRIRINPKIYSIGSWPKIYDSVRFGSYLLIKPGFHYPSWRPELTARVDGWPVSISRVDGPSTRLMETRARQHGPCWRVMETGPPSTRALREILHTDSHTNTQTNSWDHDN